MGKHTLKVMTWTVLRRELEKRTWRQRKLPCCFASAWLGSCAEKTTQMAGAEFGSAGKNHPVSFNDYLDDGMGQICDGRTNKSNLRGGNMIDFD